MTAGGLTTVGAAFAIVWLCNPVMDVMTKGMQPGDVRINDEYSKYVGFAALTHFMLSPLLSVVLLIVAALWLSRTNVRSGRMSEPAVIWLTVLGVIVSVAGWIVGFMALAVTVWNE